MSVQTRQGFQAYTSYVNTIIKGDTVEMVFPINDQNGQPVDTSSLKAWYVARKDYQTTPIISYKETDTDNMIRASGFITVKMTSSETDSDLIVSGMYLEALKVMDISKSVTVIEGKLTIKDGIAVE